MGMVDTVTHSFSTSGVSTQIEMSHILHEEDLDFEQPSLPPWLGAGNMYEFIGSGPIGLGIRGLNSLLKNHQDRHDQLGHALTYNRRPVAKS